VIGQWKLTNASQVLTRARRWVGLKAQPLLRIRYGSEDDVSLVAEGADIWRRSRVFCQRVAPPSLGYGVPGDNAFHLRSTRFAPRLMITDHFAAGRNVGCENLIKRGVHRLCPRLA